MSKHAGEDWIASWYASPEPIWGDEFPFLTNLPEKLNNQTIRQVARISLGGQRVRVELSNEYGKRPLVIGEAAIALTGTGSKIVQGSNRKLAFSGKRSIAIPIGATILSDPVELDIDPLSSVSISVFLSEETEPTTFHWDARQTTYIANGNHISDIDIDADTTTVASMYLKRIFVDAPMNAGTVVAIGDSLTDGASATVDANTRWPNFLANRLVPQNVSVLNAGISGGRLLNNVKGINVLARFDRDVLNQPNVKTVIVIIGSNDIGMPGMAFAPTESLPAADALIAGYRQLIARAHARNVRIIGGTLPPFQMYYTEVKEKLRQQVNEWIRSGEFDAVFDLDALSRDPDHPSRFLPVFDSGDHLHPGDAGNKRIAEAMDLDMLLVDRK
ncbi:Lysophospholipase L1 [Paenibacillus sophorae]|uniref:Lysophospholipase L1 n=1 Tax=Paenibacillus sophorae TaxID=1333845 RepID=A0A1H8LHH7_9BACL|nr:SGNH/GDSL hydrolase family protein [Paenibacillus sophorae]QWU17285.1 SGNH/GDSL hydrolase family protein [Paenibacillus sophorae]SEO04567.1 Lysophospholipase L1 [Paenibacillus sophorae]